MAIKAITAETEQGYAAPVMGTGAIFLTVDTAGSVVESSDQVAAGDLSTSVLGKAYGGSGAAETHPVATNLLYNTA